MAAVSDRRRELADFLRSRRAQFQRGELGLPRLPRGSTDGLRREEVCFLSGVSMTWYTWIEQARDMQPSRQVLEAIARTLRLSVRERAYILELAGYCSTDLGGLPSTRAAPAHVRRLLDALGSYPSYAITFGWDIAAWNDAYEALYPSVATMPSEERNLLRLVFTDPDVRALLPDWEVDSRRFLAQFRAEAGPRLSDPSLSALVSHLLVASAVFARLWDIHDIEPFTTRNRRFRHSLVGDLLLEHHRLTPSGEPDLNVVVYTPANETSTTHLRELLMTTTS